MFIPSLLFSQNDLPLDIRVQNSLFFSLGGLDNTSYKFYRVLYYVRVNLFNFSWLQYDYLNYISCSAMIGPFQIHISSLGSESASPVSSSAPCCYQKQLILISHTNLQRWRLSLCSENRTPFNVQFHLLLLQYHYLNHTSWYTFQAFQSLF